MAPKRKKKVCHAAGEAERRLWQYLVLYIAAVLMFCTGMLLRLDLEAAEKEQKRAESPAKETETAQKPETEEEPEMSCRRRALVTCPNWGPTHFEKFINWLADPFDRNSKDK